MFFSGIKINEGDKDAIINFVDDYETKPREFRLQNLIAVAVFHTSLFILNPLVQLGSRRTRVKNMSVPNIILVCLCCTGIFEGFLIRSVYL